MNIINEVMEEKWECVVCFFLLHILDSIPLLSRSKSISKNIKAHNTKVPQSFRNSYELNISLNSRQSIKMLTLMSCETRQRTPSWPKGTNSYKAHFQYYDDKAPSCPQSSKSHRKASFIFCSPLLPMGGHHLDLCTLTGWIQIWFDTPTENITGLQNKHGQSEQIREIYRVPTLHRNMWNIKDTLSDFVIVHTAAL